LLFITYLDVRPFNRPELRQILHDLLETSVMFSELHIHLILQLLFPFGKDGLLLFRGLNPVIAIFHYHDQLVLQFFLLLLQRLPLYLQLGLKLIPIFYDRLLSQNDLVEKRLLLLDLLCQNS